MFLEFIEFARRVPRGEIGDRLADGQGDGIHADRGSRDRPNVLPDFHGILRRLPRNCLRHGVVRHLAAVGLAVDQDIHVLQVITRIHRDQKRDGLVLPLHVPHDRIPQQRIGPLDPKHRRIIHLERCRRGLHPRTPGRDSPGASWQGRPER